MPLYEYECQDCGVRTEEIQRFSDPPLTTCKSCGGSLTKLLSAPAFHLKGSGWYATDYGGKKGGDTGAAGDGDAAGKASGGDATKNSPSGGGNGEKKSPDTTKKAPAGT